MNNILPFYHLENSMHFQWLCADLLIAEGCQNVRGIGTGADQGRDILVDVIMSSPLGDSHKRFIVQCKWYKPGNTVGQDEIAANIDYLQMHNASGILFITSSVFSGTAITKMESLDQAANISYQVKYWDGIELTRRLRKHANLIGKYWQSENAKRTKEPTAILNYDKEYFLDIYGHTQAGEFADVTFETFPVIPQNSVIVEQLRESYQSYQISPPRITILTGIVGSGKTGFAWSLLNQKRLENYEVAELRLGHFAELHFLYVLHNDYEFLNHRRFLIEVDFLLIGGIETGLWDGSDTQIRGRQNIQ